MNKMLLPLVGADLSAFASIHEIPLFLMYFITWLVLLRYRWIHFTQHVISAHRKTLYL